MRKLKFVVAISAIALLAGLQKPAAQTVGFAEAIDRLAQRCGKDIDTYCKKVDLGGGQVQKCLDTNQGGVSASCKLAVNGLSLLLKRRAQARASIEQICAQDIQQLCSGIQKGDGNLIECFQKVKRNVSAPCRQAVIDAGYDVSLDPASTSPGAIKLNSDDLVGSLQGVESAASAVDMVQIRQLIARSQSQMPGSLRQTLSEQIGRAHV